VPPIDKAKRRDAKRKKERDSEFQNARYSTLRAGESLVVFEAVRKTTVEGRPVKRRKKRK